MKYLQQVLNIAAEAIAVKASVDTTCSGGMGRHQIGGLDAKTNIDRVRDKVVNGQLIEAAFHLSGQPSSAFRTTACGSYPTPILSDLSFR